MIILICWTGHISQWQSWHTSNTHTHTSNTHIEQNQMFWPSQELSLISKAEIWIRSWRTAGPRRSHGSDCGSGGCDSGLRWVGDGGDYSAEPLLEDLHSRRNRHHHLYNLWEPVDVLREWFNRGAQLQGVPLNARFEWYVDKKTNKHSTLLQ